MCSKTECSKMRRSRSHQGGSGSTRSDDPRIKRVRESAPVLQSPLLSSTTTHAHTRWPKTQKDLKRRAIQLQPGAAISARGTQRPRHADDRRNCSRLTSPRSLRATQFFRNSATTRLSLSLLPTPADSKPVSIEVHLQQLRVLVVAFNNA